MGRHPLGTILGRLSLPESPHNMAWGDEERKTLYIAAQTSVYRVKLGVAGAGAFVKAK